MSSGAVVLERKRLGQPSGWWGMLLLITTEGALFGLLIGSYYYLRFHNEHWPLRGDPKPAVVVPLVLTFVLLATSAPMQLAVLAARRAQLGRARALLAAALLAQTGYLAMQIHLFADDVRKSPPSRDAYESAYFTLLGAHHAHVLVGLLLTLWILGRLVTGLTRYRLVALRGIALYWHFVNVLALVVTGVILSARA
jgi:heme/copper-type cytochrome/quinol oxidase subunit 3